MKHILIAIALAAPLAVSQAPKQGRWVDTTKETREASKNGSGFLVIYTGPNVDLLTEDYEVEKTHEICASVDGYFHKIINLGQYDVKFKGLRTYATFTFTTQYDAQKLVEKFCTAESLTSIRGGTGATCAANTKEKHETDCNRHPAGASVLSAQAPTIPDADKLSYFEAVAALEQAQALVRQSTDKLTKDCGSDHQPQVQKDGKLECVAGQRPNFQPPAPKAPEKK